LKKSKKKKNVFRNGIRSSSRNPLSLYIVTEPCASENKNSSVICFLSQLSSRARASTMADRINYWFYNSRAQRFSAVLTVKIVCCDMTTSSVVENCGRFGGTRYKFLGNFGKLLPSCTVSRFRQRQYSVHGANNYITESFFLQQKYFDVHTVHFVLFFIHTNKCANTSYQHTRYTNMGRPDCICSHQTISTFY